VIASIFCASGFAETEDTPKEPDTPGRTCIGSFTVGNCEADKGAPKGLGKKKVELATGCKEELGRDCLPIASIDRGGGTAVTKVFGDSDGGCGRPTEPNEKVGGLKVEEETPVFDWDPNENDGIAPEALTVEGAGKAAGIPKENPANPLLPPPPPTVLEEALNENVPDCEPPKLLPSDFLRPPNTIGRLEENSTTSPSLSSSSA